MTNINEKVFSDLDKLSSYAANFIVDLVTKNINENGYFTFVLAGGSTPKKLYELLGSRNYTKLIDWEKVYFFFGDERLVPKSDIVSNFNMVHTALFSKINIQPSQIFSPQTDLLSEETIALSYEGKIRRFFKNKPIKFDLTLLGLGSDGHTASLFPGNKLLKEKNRLVVSTKPGVLPPNVDRVTFTLPLINNSKVVLFLVTGGDKSEALKLAQNNKSVPAGLVHPSSGQLLWFVDGAAKGIKSRNG